MSLVVVPTLKDVDGYVQKTSLEGRDFSLYFRHNSRLGRWFVDVYDQDQVPIMLGVRCVANWSLGRLTVDPRKPPGTLIVVDREVGAAKDPSKCNLGETGRFALMYAESVAA